MYQITYENHGDPVLAMQAFRNNIENFARVDIETLLKSRDKVRICNWFKWFVAYRLLVNLTTIKADGSMQVTSFKGCYDATKETFLDIGKKLIEGTLRIYGDTVLFTFPGEEFIRRSIKQILEILSI